MWRRVRYWVSIISHILTTTMAGHISLTFLLRSSPHPSLHVTNLANMCFPPSIQSPVLPFNPLRPTSWSLPRSWLSAMALAIRSMQTARPLAASLQRTSGTYTPRPLATQAALLLPAQAFPPSHWPNSSRAPSPLTRPLRRPFPRHPQRQR